MHTILHILSKKIVFISLSLLILAVSFFVIRISILTKTNTEELTDPQKVLAEKAIQAQYATYLNPGIGNILKNYYVQVDSVSATSTDDIAQYCTTTQGYKKYEDPNSPEYYTVVLRISQLFNTSTQYATYDGCTIMYAEADGHNLAR